MEPETNSAFVVEVGSEPTLESSIQCRGITIDSSCSVFPFNHLKQGSEKRGFIIMDPPSRGISFVEILFNCGRVRMYPACLRQLCAVINLAPERITLPVIAMETMVQTESGFLVPVYDPHTKVLKAMTLPLMFKDIGLLLTTYRPSM